MREINTNISGGRGLGEGTTMNSYVALQMALVTAHQDTLRHEADTTRLLATARPLPAVSAGSRAAASPWPSDGEPMALQPRSLGAAAAERAESVREPGATREPVMPACDCTGSVAHAA